MIITSKHTIANHPQACSQQAVSQCNFMNKGFCDAPHFGENHNSVDGKHSELSEWYFSAVGKHSETSERYFSIGGKHSELSERNFTVVGTHSETAEWCLQPCHRYSLNLGGNVLKKADYFYSNNK